MIAATPPILASTVIRRDRHPQQPGLAQRGYIVPGVFLGPVDLRRPAAEYSLGQFACLRSQALPRVAQLKHPDLSSRFREQYMLLRFEAETSIYGKECEII
jgi:hypothetical protein